jgi:hypothetical protein
MLSASASLSQIAGPIRTGFAVVTPLTAGPLALSISETFTEKIGGNVVLTNVPPSPLVTLTSIVVHLDPASGVNTGIAIVDPFDLPATVTLSLVNPRGLIINSRTIIVGARQQLSRFVTQLFFDVPELTAPFTGQLFISSNVPIAILGLAFSGPFFSGLPAAGQLSGPITPPRSTTGLTPFAGVSSILFPQTVTGGGWASMITIANTSALPQSVRVDFFGSAESSFGSPPVFSVPNTIIQPGGVVTFSTVR